jgi:hypothetical protein
MATEAATETAELTTLYRQARKNLLLFRATPPQQPL